MSANICFVSVIDKILILPLTNAIYICFFKELVFTCAVITLLLFTDLTSCNLLKSLISFFSFDRICFTLNVGPSDISEHHVLLREALEFLLKKTICSYYSGATLGDLVLGCQSYYYLWYQTLVWIIINILSLLPTPPSSDATWPRLAISKYSFHIGSSVTLNNPVND